MSKPSSTLSDTPIFDALKGGAKVRSMHNRWTNARERAEKALRDALHAPTEAPDAEQRAAIAEQHGWHG